MSTVLGVGAVSPLAQNWPGTWRALCDGRGAVAPIDRFDATDFPCTTAAIVPGPVERDRRWQLALPAATEAMTGLDIDRDRMGLFIGAESGRATLEAVSAAMRQGQDGPTFSWERFVDDATRVIDSEAASPNAITNRLAEHFGLGGPRRTLSLACSSSAAALVDAIRALRLGHCETALVGGVGADVDPIMLAGFGKLGALSSKGSSRPFHPARDGFVVGEGAAFAVLGPGEGIRVAGVGRSLDAHHLTKPHPHGRGARLAMSQALEDAGIRDVDVVAAHGTGTPLNDDVERLAIEHTCPSAEILAVKGALGHWVAGAGTLNLLCGFEALRTGRVPPIHGNPSFPRRDGDYRTAIVNAFAFGGANSSAVLCR